MKNGVFSLDWGSIADAFVTAVVIAVVAAFVTLVSKGNFDLFTADWGAIGTSMTNIGFVAGVLSLGQSLISTNTGSVLGITPDTTPAAVPND
jgi:hypothetical protein